MMSCFVRKLPVLLLIFCAVDVAAAQDKSVKPGINDSFRDPDVKEFIGRFETESREVYTRRQEIVVACQLKPGQTVADIGAGTGLFTRLFSDAVGKEGRVIAVDISQKFLDHIRTTSREAGRQNIETLLGTADSTGLPPDVVDVAFICDTYHHFEFPQKTMASLYRALKPGGKVILVDFKRIQGQSTDWVMTHVRAGQEVFEAEIIGTGFRKIHEDDKLLKETSSCSKNPRSDSTLCPHRD
jgi:predicted methyltransferase